MNPPDDGRKTRILWGLFLGILAYAVPRTIGIALGWNPPWLIYADFIDFVVPIGFLVLFCLWTLGYGRGAVFMVLAFAISSGFEIAGLHGLGIFGGAYHYAGIHPQVFGLPLIIPFYWAGLIFVAFSFVNSFLTWTGRSKPARGQGNAVLLPLLVALDGLFVTAVDLAMDPICVEAGLWTWDPPGPFFGVPLNNFLGWFIVAALSTGIFRTHEFLHPSRGRPVPETLAILSVLSYGLIGVGLFLEARIFRLAHIMILPLVSIAPALIINGALFLSRRPRGF